MNAPLKPVHPPLGLGSPTAPPMGALPEQMAVTAYANLLCPDGTTRCLPWHAFVGRLTHVRPALRLRDKPAQASWCPAAFTRTGSNRAEAVQAVSALVLDLEEGIGVQAVLRALDALDFVVYSTWSHRPDRPRLRVIIPLTRPIPGSRWAEAWRLAVSLLGLPVDPRCKEANWRYLWMARRWEARSTAPFWLHVATGRALDLLAILPPLAPPTRATPETKRSGTEAKPQRQP